jgi:CRISPR-associated protein Cmr4
MNTAMLFWQALTPIHPGTGQVSASVIDLPVAREVATNYPFIPASSLKGVLRNGREDAASNVIFGQATGETVGDAALGRSVGTAAALSLTDARLLCFPVRSYRGTFALITCPTVLRRLERDTTALQLAGVGSLAQHPGDGIALVADNAVVYVAQGQNQKVIFEDIDLQSQHSPEASKIAQTIAELALPQPERRNFIERFVVVSDDVFGFFVDSATEVIARVRLDPQTKTVEQGGLWYEEAIPAETLFSSFAMVDSGRLSGHNAWAELKQHPWIQVGGDASVGRGLLRLCNREGLGGGQ